ncbi:MAG: flavodoxin family protein [Bacteroidales bacterium]|nr:flavodoxin family protein [Bacteroidales bacterium]
MKKVVIINGNPGDQNPGFDSYLHQFNKAMLQNGYQSEIIHLKNMNIISCTGCWGCWVKTPGECLFQDDTMLIRNQIIHSDWVVFASPLIMGFTSALLKMVQDKLIPLLHPYIELVNNECHHMKRYDHYPMLGLIYSPEPESDKEDIQIVNNIYKRFALNFKSELIFSQSIDQPVNSLVHEIINH